MLKSPTIVASNAAHALNEGMAINGYPKMNSADREVFVEQFKYIAQQLKAKDPYLWKSCRNRVLAVKIAYYTFRHQESFNTFGFDVVFGAMIALSGYISDKKTIDFLRHKNSLERDVLIEVTTGVHDALIELEKMKEQSAA